MKGFTLIELIVVITLMAILAAMAAPRFFESGAIEGPAFARELAAAARYAQKLAVTGGCPVRLVIPDATSYQLLQPLNPPSGACDTTYTLNVTHPGTGGAFAGTAPSGVTIGVTVPFTIQFDANGVPWVGASELTTTLSIPVAGQNVLIAARSGHVEVQVP